MAEVIQFTLGEGKKGSYRGKREQFGTLFLSFAKCVAELQRTFFSDSSQSVRCSIYSGSLCSFPSACFGQQALCTPEASEPVSLCSSHIMSRRRSQREAGNEEKQT